MLTLHFAFGRDKPCPDFIIPRLSPFSEDGPERRRPRVPRGVPADVPERRDHVQERLRLLQRRRLKLKRGTDNRQTD